MAVSGVSVGAARLATRETARQAAQRAAFVQRALLKAPPAPKPVGSNVNLSELQSALPWLRWRDLQEFAGLFGQRGTADTAVATSVAEELGRRLVRCAPESSQVSAAVSDNAEVTAGMAPAEARKAWEVATVTYAYAKLVPQVPAYLPLYTAVADGVKQGIWTFNRLQSGLVATALVDANVRLDALPALLRPALRGLRGKADVTADELRYLLHACALLPAEGGDGLTADEVSALSACILRVVPSANFSKTTHITVGWLRVHVPSKAKGAYLEALQATCSRLFDQGATGHTLAPMLPSHPLPSSGLAPAVSALIARECERDPPPLTPPRLRSVALALVQICRGIISDASSRKRHVSTRALSLADWVEMLQAIAAFCEAHGPQPGWAAEVVGFVAARVTTLPSEDGGPPNPEALLGLLKLCKLFRPRPQPPQQLYEWIAQKLVAHRAANGDSALLAEASRHLVPFLPAGKRQDFIAVLQTQAEADAAAPITVGAQDGGILRTPDVGSPPTSSEHKETLLAGKVWWHDDHPSVTLSNSAAAPVAAADCATAVDVAAVRASSPEPGNHAQVSAARLIAAASYTGVPGGHLWRLFSADSQKAAPVSASLDASSTASKQAIEGASTATAVHELSGTDAREEAADDESLAALKAKLQRALQRAEELESRLEERLEQLDRAEAQQEQAAKAVSSEAPEAEGEAPSAPPSLSTVFTLHRPFNFEEFRRANSARLQSERLRVLLPPGRVPIIPLK